MLIHKSFVGSKIAYFHLIAVGTNTEIEKYCRSNTKTLDIISATMLPGINDSHGHLISFASERPTYMLDFGYPTVKSIADFSMAVAQKAAVLPEGEWIYRKGQGFGVAGRSPFRMKKTRIPDV